MRGRTQSNPLRSLDWVLDDGRRIPLENGFFGPCAGDSTVVGFTDALLFKGALCMRCLFNNHHWNYDLRFYHISRKCQACGQVQRHVWNKESVYTEWEKIREQEYVESKQRQIVRAPSSQIARLAHALRLLRNRSADRSRRQSHLA